ncbi:unnamed protein product, partial [Heterosigma akashiwo]
MEEPMDTGESTVPISPRKSMPILASPFSTPSRSRKMSSSFRERLSTSRRKSPAVRLFESHSA